MIFRLGNEMKNMNKCPKIESLEAARMGTGSRPEHKRQWYDESRGIHTPHITTLQVHGVAPGIKNKNI